MIEFTDVTKTFAGRPALSNLSLNLAEGKTHVLLGSSGSGKSTLLRLAVGLIFPDKGEVTVGKTRVSKANQREIAENIGYVIQEGGLFPHLTAVKNITLAATTRGWPRKKIDERTNELLTLAYLEEPLLRRYPRQLSGGQRQRVGLLRALFLNPKVLLLDEPLGALDPLVRSALQNELKTIFTRLKKTVILVTHDVGEAAYFGDTITLFHEGKAIQHGTLGELMTKPATPFVTEFFQAQRRPPELRVFL